MSKGLNRVFLIGHAGSDPILRYTPSGIPTVILNLYESEKYTDKKTNEKKEITYRHRVVFFNKHAETAHKFIKKGLRVHIEGKMCTRSWKDKSGSDLYITEVLVKSLLLLDYATNDGFEDKQVQDEQLFEPSPTDFDEE